MDKEGLERLRAFDALRIMGAFCVVLYHYNKFTATGHDNPLFPFYSVFRFAYLHGGIFVELFFLLSGVTFFSVYADKVSNHEIGFADFMGRRAARLLPLYWLTTAAILLTVVASECFLGDHMSGLGVFLVSPKYILLNILGIGRGWLDNRIYLYNSAAWTISVELFCYLVFFALCRWAKGEKMRTALTVMLMFAGELCVLYDLQLPILNVEMGRGVSCFFFGGLLAQAWGAEGRKILRLLPLIGLAELAMLVVYRDRWLVYSFFLFPGLLWFVYRCGTVNRFFRGRFWTAAAKLSFSIYLDQIPLMSFVYLLSKWIPFDYYSPVFWAGYLVSLVLLSCLTYQTVEKKGKRILYHYRLRRNITWANRT